MRRSLRRADAGFVLATRPSLALLAVALLAIGAAWLAGRHRAQTALAGEAALQARHDSLQRQFDATQQRLLQLEQQQQGLTAERAESARQLAQLQSQLAREAQDAAFYRAIATGTGDAAVAIQRLRIQAFEQAGRYRLTLVLTRPLGREDTVRGRGTLQLSGQQGGRPVHYALGQLSVDKSADWVFNYQYILKIDIDVALPDGFVPDRVTIELLPDRAGQRGLRQAFLWQPAVP